jgi:hypothetical protein
LRFTALVAAATPLSLLFTFGEVFLTWLNHASKPLGFDVDEELEEEAMVALGEGYQRSKQIDD